METQNVIKTLFEYTSKGYEEANKTATELLGKIAALRTQDKELNKTLTESDAVLDKNIKRWQELDQSMNVNTPKKVRDEFARLKKDIEATTATKAKAAQQQQVNAKALDAENKKVKEATELQETYKKVLDELDKGMKNAEVSTGALAKAKKYLNEEMSKTDVGTEKYAALSKEMAIVTKTSNDITAAQRQQVKEMGVAENSVEGLRLKVAELKKEWLEMDRADPGFKAKADELRQVTDELTTAEAEVGIFSRSVGGYKEQIKTLIPEFTQLGEGMGLLGPVGQIAQKGIKGVSTAFKALMANPIVAFFAALVLGIKAFVAISDKIATKSAEKFTKAVKQETSELKRNSEELTHNVNMLRARGATAKEVADAELEAATKASLAAHDMYSKFLAEYENMSRQARKKAKETLDGLKADADAASAALEETWKRHEVTMVSEQTKQRKEAIDRAKADQENANADYIKAMQDRMKSAEDVAKAEAAGDTQAIESLRKILAIRENELATASGKRLTLSQLEKDELELQEYLHQRALDEIQNDAEQKRRDEITETADNYLNALADERSAREALLEAQKRGNAVEIALYQRLLDQKSEALAQYNADEVQLSEEKRLAEEMAAFDHQQKVINDYIAIQQQLTELQNQYQEAQTQAEQEAIQKQINLVNAKVAEQVLALQALGVNIAGINVDVEQSIDTTQQYLSDRLQQSLQTIEQFSGRSKNNFFKLATSITGLVAKAFDFKKVTEGMDKTSKGFKKLKGEFMAGMAEIGAAAAINGINAAVDIINQNIEAEKQAIDEMYAYQERRAQESYDQQSRDLKAALDDKEISEAKYRLEQMKLDDKKAEEDKKREKDKANAMYDLEVKQFRVNQAKDAISTVIATSLGIMQSYAQAGPIVGSILAAVVGALGAAQVGLIYAQKPPQKPKFEKGGGIRFEQIDGPSHKDGGVPIRFGNKVVAEAEGDEGALIISKKAMRNNYMRQLLAFVESVGAGISGAQSDPSKFAEGGYLSYDEDFFIPARNSLKITKRKKRSIRINGKKVKLKPYGWNADAAIDDYAEKIAIPKWNAYIDQERAKLDNREAEINDAINAGISNNETLKSMGVTDIESFNKLQADKEKELDTVQKQIKVYEEAANARIDALKAELQYDQKLADFEKQRKDAASELATATEEFNTRVLGELREAGQITEEEYLSMLDQVKHGYGVKTTDIINLKKKEVEAIKKLINEERDTELNAAKETAKYREDALAQMRSEWEENYNAITQRIIEDAESASDAISQLTGTDLERFNQILNIQQEIKKMEEDYAKNETLLTDGVITSREERAALVAEQKRIKEELARKEQESEEAKAAFESERQKNMEAAMKAYETENFADLLAQIKELGADLQAEGNKWTLDKELASELDAELQSINATYDEQIAKQDAIIDGLQAEIDAAQLLHDKKVAYIKEEEEALKATFEEQKAAIDTWLANATSGLRTEAAELSQFLAALKVAGIEAGLTEYEKAMEELNKNIDALESKGGKKYATGGAIEIGSGLYQVAGPSHSHGGVPIRVGNTQIAEVEGIEKMFAVNKMAANDPEMMEALAKASNINARYSGVSLIESGSGEGFTLDYDLLAAKIGAQINSRPTKTFMTHRDVRSAYDITDMHKKASFMK